MYKNNTILALITARGGSKGVKRKNIREVGGKPLITWSIIAGKKSKYIDRMIVSSEDNEIIRISEQYGCEVPFTRPIGLAQDKTSSVDVAIHAIQSLRENYDYLLLLQPTSPLRDENDIDQCIEFFFSKQAESCTSIRKTNELPYRMFFLQSDASLIPVIPNNYNRRQDMPYTYITNGAIYLIKIKFLLDKKTFVDENTIGFVMPIEKSYDIDCEEDLKKCSQILLQLHGKY